MSAKVYLLGWPVGHSLSPRMHEAAFRTLGLDWSYSVIGVRPRQLARVLADLSLDPAFRGANVTIPHKRAVLGLLAEADSGARALGAVNVISRRDDGNLWGHNTDCSGFLGALTSLRFRPQGSRCLILGAGGAARACVFALGTAGAAALRVVSRRPEQSWRLVRDLRPSLAEHAPQAVLEAGSWDELRAGPGKWFGEARGRRRGDGGMLVVNATPVGMWPDDARSPLTPADVARIPEGTLVYDLVYNPPRTRLVRIAMGAGLPASGGEEMLVLQGAAALEHWLGKPLSAEIAAVMRRALAAATEEVPTCSAT